MTTRREFLQQAGLIATASVIFPTVFAKSHFKLGLQLYTVHKEMSSNVQSTLQKVASFGYQEVETYGFNYGNNKNYWNIAPKTLKAILDDNHLTTSSGHYDLDKFMLPGKTADDLKRYVDQCIEGASVLKQNYIVWPWLDPQSRSMERFKVVAEKLNKIGEQIKQAKLQLAYHNHDFEFIDHNGKIGYDIILNETDPALVKLELDLYWISHTSKLKAHDYFIQQPGRFVCWHIKDMDKTNRELHTIVGDGTINFNDFFVDAKLAGVKHIFVEQGNNYVPDAFHCIEKSAKYIRNNILL